MMCDDIKNVMADFLSGVLDETRSDEVHQHLVKCAFCQEELEVYKKTWKALESWEDQEPDPAYLSRFWNRLAQQKSWTERLQSRWPGFTFDKRLVPVACSLIFLVVMGGMTLYRQVQEERTERLLTSLSAEEIGFVENIELVENFDFYQEMDMLEGLSGSQDFS